MHIYEGVLSATSGGQEVLAIGTAGAVLGTALGLYKLPYERLPQVAVLSSAFFVASLIHIPLPPSSTHLTLTGLMGLLLGRAAFPAVLVALLLQAVFFSFGGLTVLGVNTVIMGLPAVVCYYLFRRGAASRSTAVVGTVGFAAGATAILLSGLLSAAALLAAGKEFQLAGLAMLAVHLPAALLEGLVTASILVFVHKVRPEALLLAGSARPAQGALHG